MVPLYFTISNSTPVMIIPDAQGHVDGHPVLTYTYNIYRDTSMAEAELDRKRSELHLERIKDPDFLGVLTFEIPGRVFTYTANGNESLSPDDVEEIVQNITYYRENSDLWQY